MCFFFYPANEQGHSLSLSKKFDSDKELLHPIFSLSKKFDSDNEFLIYMTNVIKYICLFYSHVSFVSRLLLQDAFFGRIEQL